MTGRDVHWSNMVPILFVCRNSMTVRLVFVCMDQSNKLCFKWHSNGVVRMVVVLTRMHGVSNGTLTVLFE